MVSDALGLRAEFGKYQAHADASGGVGGARISLHACWLAASTIMMDVLRLLQILVSEIEGPLKSEMDVDDVAIDRFIADVVKRRTRKQKPIGGERKEINPGNL